MAILRDSVFASSSTLVIIKCDPHILFHTILTDPKVWPKGGRVVDGLVFQHCFTGLLLHLFVSFALCVLLSPPSFFHYPDITLLQLQL